MTMLLTIVVPVYNEVNYIQTIVERIRNAPLPAEVSREIVIVDDCSTDGTRDKLKEIEKLDGVHVHYHEKNTGKGGALHTAFQHAKGDFVLIQDADLEYDPAEYPRLVAPIINQRADIVYGSRFVTGEQRRVLYYWHSVVNQQLTRFCNMITNLNLTDMEVCYKVIRVEPGGSLTL